MYLNSTDFNVTLPSNQTKEEYERKEVEPNTVAHLLFVTTGVCLMWRIVWIIFRRDAIRRQTGRQHTNQISYV